MRWLFEIIKKLPKKKYFLLKGYPDFDENLVVIQNELIGWGIHNIVWIVSDPDKAPLEIKNTNIKVIKKNSLASLYYSLFCKFVIITHGSTIPHSNIGQVCINIWHGVPYKKLLIQKSKFTNDQTQYIATSDFVADLFSGIFSTSKTNIRIIGQPRTDNFLIKNIEEHRQEILKGINDIKKIFLYIPTYREYSILSKSENKFMQKGIFYDPSFDTEEFHSYLVENNIICLYKYHPMEQAEPDLENWSNIIKIDEPWLRARNTTLYRVCAVADGLISDISSIIIDFMLLDKPMLLFFPDLNEYSATRGFQLNPISKWLPARVTMNYQDFMTEFHQMSQGNDLYREQRNQLKNIFHGTNTGNSAHKVVSLAFDSLDNDNPMRNV